MCVNREFAFSQLTFFFFLNRRLFISNRKLLFLFLVTSLLHLPACLESWEILYPLRQFMSINEKEEKLPLASQETEVFRKQKTAPLCYSHTYAKAFYNGDF